MFKVGELVRRKKEFLDEGGWQHYCLRIYKRGVEEPFEIVGAYDGYDGEPATARIRLAGDNARWKSERFEPVYPIKPLEDYL